MEELRILAKEYYQTTVDIRLYRFWGIVCLVASIPFIFWSIHLNFVDKLSNASILPMLVAAVLWAVAKKQYNKNLIRRLTYYTHYSSESISEHKAVYIQYLTEHIAPNLYEVMKAFRDITEADKENRSFVLDNGWYHFFRFLYDPDSKNRILSLLIYLISLLAILSVVKPDTGFHIFDLVSAITFEQVKNLFAVALVVIVMGYVMVLVPVLFFVSYIAIPLLLKLSSANMLCRHFISEINKFAFLDARCKR